ncbi:MAG: methyl-accepting chemotaxis protein, partial [Methanobacteriota archaeon]
AETVEEAAQSMLQISISTKEQYVGVDQMTTAVEDIKISMENNIEGIKQIEESLEDLKSLSEKIKEIVETYRV